MRKINFTQLTHDELQDRIDRIEAKISAAVGDGKKPHRGYYTEINMLKALQSFRRPLIGICLNPKTPESTRVMLERLLYGKEPPNPEPEKPPGCSGGGENFCLRCLKPKRGWAQTCPDCIKKYGPVEDTHSRRAPDGSIRVGVQEITCLQCGGPKGKHSSALCMSCARRLQRGPQHWKPPKRTKAQLEVRDRFFKRMEAAKDKDEFLSDLYHDDLELEP